MKDHIFAGMLTKIDNELYSYSYEHVNHGPQVIYASFVLTERYSEPDCKNNLETNNNQSFLLERKDPGTTKLTTRTVYTGTLATFTTLYFQNPLNIS